MKALLGTFEIQSEPHSWLHPRRGGGEDEQEGEMISEEGLGKSELMNQSLLSCGCGLWRGEEVSLRHFSPSRRRN